MVEEALYLKVDEGGDENGGDGGDDEGDGVGQQQPIHHAQSCGVASPATAVCRSHHGTCKHTATYRDPQHTV